MEAFKPHYTCMELIAQRVKYYCSNSYLCSMAGINKAIILGNLGKDPEMRHTQSGIPVCSFPVATSEVYVDRNTGDRKETTEWHNVVLWRKLAETAEKYLHKGSQVYIEGKIRTRSWEDESGQKRYTTEIVGDVMQLLGRPGDQQDQRSSNSAGAAAQQAQSKPAENPAMASDDGDEGDLPF